MDTRARLPAEPALIPSIVRIIECGPVLDADGRPILESQAHPSVRTIVDHDYTPCTYESSPSRVEAGKPMRMAGYRQAKDHFDELLWMLDLLRRLRLESVGRELPTPLDLRRICMCGEALPRYMRLRDYCERVARGPAELEDYRVPAPASVTFKAVRGVITVANHILAQPRAMEKAARRARKQRESTNDTSEEFHWDAHDYHWVAEKYGLMVGKTEVCAGTPSMIQRTLETLVNGRSADDSPTWTAELIGDTAQFMECDQVLADLEDFRQRFKAKCREALKTMESVERKYREVNRLAKIFKAQHKPLAAYLRAERSFIAGLQDLQGRLLSIFDHHSSGPPPTLAELDTYCGPNPRALLQGRGYAFEIGSQEIVVKPPMGRPDQALRVAL